MFRKNYICISYILIHYIYEFVCDGVLQGEEGEAGEAASDWCQSVIGLGNGRAGHGLGTDTGGN